MCIEWEKPNNEYQPKDEIIELLSKDSNVYSLKTLRRIGIVPDDFLGKIPVGEQFLQQLCVYNPNPSETFLKLLMRYVERKRKRILFSWL
jgi:hypothetical protein